MVRVLVLRRFEAELVDRSIVDEVVHELAVRVESLELHHRAIVVLKDVANVPVQQTYDQVLVVADEKAVVLPGSKK